MTDERPGPEPPISAHPITTMFEGVEINSGQPAQTSPDLAAIVAEDRRVFGRAVPADFDALRRACQQAPDAMPLKRYYDGEALSDAPEWRGTRVEIIAFSLTPDDRASNETLRVPVGHPWVFWELPNIDGPCIVARWCHRSPGRPGVLEVAWDGRRLFATQTRRSVHILGGEGSGADAARLMSLWTATTEATLRPRTRTAQEYIQHRGRMLATYCRDRGITDPMDLSRTDVAEALAYSDDKSLRNALNQKGVRTDHIKAEAYRLIWGDHP